MLWDRCHTRQCTARLFFDQLQQCWQLLLLQCHCRVCIAEIACYIMNTMQFDSAAKAQGRQRWTGLTTSGLVVSPAIKVGS